jgi:hypothetical protein
MSKFTKLPNQWYLKFISHEPFLGGGVKFDLLKYIIAK